MLYLIYRFLYSNTECKHTLPLVILTAEKQSVEEEEEMPDLQNKDVQRVTKKMQFAFRSKKSPQPPAEQ